MKMEIRPWTQEKGDDSLQAMPFLAAALSKTECRRCIEPQAKAVQSATDSSRSVLQCQRSTTTQAAKQKPEARLARHQ
ncbi:hypothetical protein WJX79_001280 [Trebouxia sp. C0005]